MELEQQINNIWFDFSINSYYSSMARQLLFLVCVTYRAWSNGSKNRKSKPVIEMS